jgi:hypothetical protein
MRDKIRDISYFLTIWFATSVIVLYIIALAFGCAAKHKQTYTLESIPTYDSLGNLYGIRQEYDHIPTHQDSIDFEIDSDKAIQKTMDSVFSTK